MFTPCIQSIQQIYGNFCLIYNKKSVILMQLLNKLKDDSNPLNKKFWEKAFFWTEKRANN